MTKDTCPWVCRSKSLYMTIAKAIKNGEHWNEVIMMKAGQSFYWEQTENLLLLVWGKESIKVYTIMMQMRRKDIASSMSEKNVRESEKGVHGY